MESIKDGIKFILDNSQKVFTGIIVFMLIIFTFFQGFLRVISEYISFQESAQERIELDLILFKFKLLSTQYDLVSGIMICMILLYFHHIITYILQSKLGLKDQQLPQKNGIYESTRNNIEDEELYESFQKENEKYIKDNQYGNK
jgi:hypothetical protein